MLIKVWDWDLRIEILYMFIIDYDFLSDCQSVMQDIDIR